MLITESVYRIEARGTQSRYHAPDAGCRSKRDGCGSDVERVAGRDSLDQQRGGLRQPQETKNTNHETEEDQYARFPQHQLQDLPTGSTQGRMDFYLPVGRPQSSQRKYIWPEKNLLLHPILSSVRRHSHSVGG